MSIDFDFIGELEGGQALQGYVPDAKNSKSGVTIATGFDIGQRSVSELRSVFDCELYSKLCAYSGLVGTKAQLILDKYPLSITRQEADQVDEYSHRQSIANVTKMYNRQSNVSFDELPSVAQTVIASVAFQYGDLSRKCPKFWDVCVNQNWQGAYNELINFGDRYPTRRNKEAKLLGAILND